MVTVSLDITDQVWEVLGEVPFRRMRRPVDQSDEGIAIVSENRNVPSSIDIFGYLIDLVESVTLGKFYLYRVLACYEDGIFTHHCVRYGDARTTDGDQVDVQ